MLIFRLTICCISWSRSKFPFGYWSITKLICNIIFRSLRCRVSITVDICHLFGCVFLRLCLSSWCSKRVEWSRWFLRFSHFSKSRVYFCSWKFNEILICINFSFFNLSLLAFEVFSISHCSCNINYFYILLFPCYYFITYFNLLDLLNINTINKIVGTN